MAHAEHSSGRKHTAGDILTRAVVLGLPLATLMLGAAGIMAERSFRSEASAATLAFLDASERGHATAGASTGTDNCAACHQVMSSASHPVGVVPSMKVPESMPLTDGRVSCLTCHDGSAAQDHPQRKPSGQMFLRGEEASASTCTQCHTGANVSKSPHGQSRAMAHASSKSGSGVGAARSGAVGLDAESRSCLQCHDGTLAGDAGKHKPGSMFSSNASHPIGVKYQSRPAGATDPINLKPIRALDSRVRLYDGHIGCGSCHNVYAKEPKLLVMDNHASSLCVACHVQ